MGVDCENFCSAKGGQGGLVEWDFLVNPGRGDSCAFLPKLSQSGELKFGELRVHQKLLELSCP